MPTLALRPLVFAPVSPPPALPSAARLGVIVLVSALAGGVNAIAGGGTLLTFPSLIALGIPPIIANATSTVALWPGSVGTIWGYREELSGAWRWALWYAAPSVAGGAVGALLLLDTSDARFAMLVPWLVLAATVLFVAHGPLLRALRAWAAAGHQTVDERTAISGRPSAGVLVAQFGIGIYGGYFGAGIGILMLAALGFMGLANIHRMNGLKGWGGMCINAVAAAIFIAGSLVRWPIALAMAGGSVAGGYGAARIARRVPQAWVRWTVVVVGFSSAVWLYVAQQRGLF